MLKVGLTGGIGSGKSTVAQVFGQRGAHVLDADLLARELVSPGSPALGRIAGVFGAEVLRPDGTLDRTALGAAVFADPVKRRTLEQILHPPILAEIDRRVAALERSDPQGIVVIDAALVFELGLEGKFDAVVVVWAEEAQQIDRVRLRDGLSEGEARRRLAAQLPLAEKCRRADFVVDNSGTPDAGRADAARVYERLLQRAGRTQGG